MEIVKKVLTAEISSSGSGSCFRLKLGLPRRTTRFILLPFTCKTFSASHLQNETAVSLCVTVVY
jgi:hypothetical protein